MHLAFPKSWFDALGLVSLLDSGDRVRNRTYGGVGGRRGVTAPPTYAGNKI
jgi:hypothetical protein